MIVGLCICAKGFMQVRATSFILVIYMQWAFKYLSFLLTFTPWPASVTLIMALAAHGAEVRAEQTRVHGSMDTVSFSFIRV